MKTRTQRMVLALGVWAVTGVVGAQAMAQHVTLLDFPGLAGVPRLTIQSELGITNQIQYTNNLSPSNWAVLATVVVTQSPYTYLDLSAPPAPRRFYRVVDPNPPAPTNLPPPAPVGMVWIPGGTFVMGDTPIQHTVTLSGFYMSRYELTQGEYLAVVGNNPSTVTGDLNRPVETVSWYDATNYCHQLNMREGRLGSGWVYRLPTESEWEYACRAGTTTPFHYGPNLLSGMANFFGYSEYVDGGPRWNPSGIFLERTTAVGSYAPNAFGLYDMHGNVSEWCLDWYGPYPTGSVADPRGPGTGSFRVFRGGLYSSEAAVCRSAQRAYEIPSYPYGFTGFRPVLAPGQ